MNTRSPSTQPSPTATTTPLPNQVPEHGPTGHCCWPLGPARRDLDLAARQHFTTVRLTRHAVEQTNVRATRKETTR